MDALPDQAACQVLDVAPLVMQAIRTQVKRHRAPRLSVLQFRVLAFLEEHKGATLSEVAEHTGVVLPSMSKLVDGLVIQKRLAREFCVADRRCVTLKLTPRGRTLLHATRASTRAYLVELFEALPASECLTIVDAMRILRLLFTCERKSASARGM